MRQRPILYIKYLARRAWIPTKGCSCILFWLRVDKSRGLWHKLHSGWVKGTNVDSTRRRCHGERVLIAYKMIFDRIYRRHLQDGSWLMESAIAKELGASRATVRDCLRLLEQDGLIAIVPRKGMRVAALTADDLEDVFETSRVLELHALPYALPALSIHGLQEIRAEVDRIAESDDAGLYAEVDERLHRFLVVSSNRRRFISMFDGLSRIVSSFRLLAYESAETRQAATRDHRLLIDALCQRSLDSARALLHAHGQDLESRVLAVLTRSYSTAASRPGEAEA